MYGGQEIEAGRLFSEAVVTGAWLLLANVHYSGQWTSQLIRSILSLPGQKPHADFRLWLSADTGAVPQVLTLACQSISFASAVTDGEVRGQRLVTTTWPLLLVQGLLLGLCLASSGSLHLCVSASCVSLQGGTETWQTEGGDGHSQLFAALRV